MPGLTQVMSVSSGTGSAPGVLTIKLRRIAAHNRF
ncbi:hypothetical protein AIGOOFII_2446 [Methylobacterium marchantiae]|nr:hypothetical protein AIGOOFII_2446 [Methylobacterium marchantiae]